MSVIAYNRPVESRKNGSCDRRVALTDPDARSMMKAGGGSSGLPVLIKKGTLVGLHREGPFSLRARHQKCANRSIMLVFGVPESHFFKGAA